MSINLQAFNTISPSPAASAVFATIAAKSGPVSLAEFRRSFGDAIPGFAFAVAQALELSTPELFDRIRRGKLSFEQLQKVIEDARR